jgi:hypothetical protein
LHLLSFASFPGALRSGSSSADGDAARMAGVQAEGDVLDPAVVLHLIKACPLLHASGVRNWEG